MTPSLALGLLMIVVAALVAGRRLWWLSRLIRSGQPAVGRTDERGVRLQAEVVEVVGQRKLLAGRCRAWRTRSRSGASRPRTDDRRGVRSAGRPELPIPVIDQWAWIPGSRTSSRSLVLVALAVFTVIRLMQDPHRRGRASRFFGSHTGAAWLVLFMIFNVIWTLLLYRGAQIEHRRLPLPDAWAFASNWVGEHPAERPRAPTRTSRPSGCCCSIGVILGFLVLVVYSKHLHIFMAPLNVAFSRRPNALGPLLPMYSGTTLIDFEDPGEDDVFGRGKVEDFTWKGLLDFATCTECGRCQSQCPAWNTEKPLSPKLLVMDLRDHAFAKAPYLLADRGGRGRRCRRPYGLRPNARWSGSLEERRGHHPGRAVVVHVVRRLRRAVPRRHRARRPHHGHAPLPGDDRVARSRTELNGLFKNLENKGNPWGMNSSDATPGSRRSTSRCASSATRARTAPDDVEWLLWVGCAGAFEDRAKRTRRRPPSCCTWPGSSSWCWGRGRPAPATRRAGPATSSSSRCSRSRTSRCSTRSA